MRRYIDGPGGKDGQVGHQPFHLILRNQADPIADLNARVDQGSGASENNVSILLPAHVMVKAVVLVAQRRARSQALCLPFYHLRQSSKFHVDNLSYCIVVAKIGLLRRTTIRNQRSTQLGRPRWPSQLLKNVRREIQLLPSAGRLAKSTRKTYQFGKSVKEEQTHQPIKVYTRLRL